MKKVLSLILALVLCLSLFACGSSPSEKQPSSMDAVPESSSTAPTASDTTDVTPDEVVYTMGQTVSTEIFEFTPVFEGFADEVANWPDENFMTPDGKISGNNPFKADEDKVIMYFSADVKYIGNSKSNETFSYDFTIDYADGYIFEFNERYDCGVQNDDGWDYSNEITFEPLSSEKDGYVRFCIEVPSQLESDPNNILIIFNIGGNDYQFSLG